MLNAIAAYLLIVWGHMNLASSTGFALYLLCCLTVWQWAFGTLQNQSNAPKAVPLASIKDEPSLFESMQELAVLQAEVATMRHKFHLDHPSFDDDATGTST